MKVLLVDDEQALLDVFTQALQTAGFSVISALSGTDGITKAKLEKPDMILLDQVMPDINGNQVLQMLKSDPATASIPVAILSNFNQDNLVQDAINLGAVDYILKYQIEAHDLVEKINQIIKENVKTVVVETPTGEFPVPSTQPISEAPAEQSPMQTPAMTSTPVSGVSQDTTTKII